MRHRVLSVALAVVCGATAAVVNGLLFPVPVVAHGGGLDASGCHWDRKNGDYHCHRAPATAPRPTPRTAAPATPRQPAPVPAAVAGVAAPAALPTPSHVDVHDAPQGNYQRFTAEEIASRGLRFETLAHAPMMAAGKEWLQVRVHAPSGLVRSGYVQAGSVGLALAPSTTASVVQIPATAMAAPSAPAAPASSAFCGLDRRMFELMVSMRIQNYESTGESWSARAARWRNEIAGNIAGGRNTAALDATFGRYERYCAEGDDFMAGIAIGEWVGIGLRAP